MDKLGIKWNFLNMIKDIFGKPIANVFSIIMEVLLHRLKNKSRRTALFSALLLNIVLEALACAKRKLKEIKGKQIRQEEAQLLNHR